MIGAKFGLRVAPQTVSKQECPAVLSGCPGTVARLEEQVISPAGFVADLSLRNRNHILKIDAVNGIVFEFEKPGVIHSMRIVNPETRKQLALKPGHVIFTAGAGNAELRRRAGLSTEVMQRRPLHMVMLRGEVPVLNGHCVDGAKTRVTITTDTDTAGRTVWQVGGQIAEVGTGMNPLTLIAYAKSELETVLPGLSLDDVEWATYRVDRAEAATPGGKRPETVQIIRDGNTITAWPTKLVLAPRLAEEIASGIETQIAPDFDHDDLSDWPRPDVASPPWETCDRWYRDHQLEEKAA